MRKFAPRLNPKLGQLAKICHLEPLRERIHCENMHSAEIILVPYLEVGAVGAPFSALPGMWSRNTPVHGTTEAASTYALRRHLP